MLPQSHSMEKMGDERSGVYPILFNKAKDLLAIASIYPTGLESEVFSVHFGQWKNLGLVVKGHHSYNGIWSGALPCLICKSLVQILLIVTRTIASVDSINLGLGFSTKANFPFSMYVYDNIIVYLYHQHNPPFCLDKHFRNTADKSINLTVSDRLSIFADM